MPDQPPFAPDPHGHGINDLPIGRGPGKIPTWDMLPAPTPRVTFVYRPGGVAVDNVYTNWNLLYAAFAAVQGPKEVQFDNSFLAPLTPLLIPPRAGGGFYSLQGGSARGVQSTEANITNPGPIVRFGIDIVRISGHDHTAPRGPSPAKVRGSRAGGDG